VDGEVTLNAVPVNGPSACVAIWRANDDPEAGEVSVTVTEIDWTPGTFLEHLYVNTVEVDAEEKTATVVASFSVSGQIIFKNAGVPDEEPGLEGCTPGFWRQTQHYEFWTAPYVPNTPGSAWTTAFNAPIGTHKEPGKNGATFTGATTLIEAVQFGGGGIFALARHAVAALLNASSAGVDYPLTVGQVQSLVNAAIASGEYEDAKNELVGYNELGCDVK
jgi:hypothetical protein